ncbi:hypothetical protein DXG03_008196 [Asterophora parasitica]|uniref:Uncharacterized protein n=1 Tax=Asterophora parasitica TaxID=117018 RepID=A0A9P7G7A0_9AGAR|nr:hypothetical protein DXG03_008196 [Asterophora parasitica]
MSDALTPEVAPPSFEPPVDTPEVKLIEHADFAGITISQILYGITIILFFQCMRGLLLPRKSSGIPRNIYMGVYTFALFGLGTVFIAMNARNNELAYIDYRGFPGGPVMFTFSRYNKAIVIVPNAAFILANWLADGLLVSSLFLNFIWGDNYWTLILPILMYIGSIAMGIMTIFQSSRPNATLWSKVTVDFGLPYFCLATSLNVLLTLLISSRLYLHHRMMKKAGSVGSSVIPYASITGMLVESSVLYAVSSLLFIGTYGANNGASALFLPILSQTQIIAPLLIISRVARQRAYGSTTNRQSDPVWSRGATTVTTGRTRTTTDTIPLETSQIFSSFEGNRKHSAEKVHVGELHTDHIV